MARVVATDMAIPVLLKGVAADVRVWYGSVDNFARQPVHVMQAARGDNHSVVTWEDPAGTPAAMVLLAQYVKDWK